MRGEHIKILIFDDRLEILSPGLLPNIVTIENILTQRYSRNPRIARILCEFGWVKEMNEGVKRIYSEMEKVFLNKPQYSEPNNNVLLVLENNVINRNIRTGDQIERVISRASELTTRGTTFCRKMLKNLERKKILKWIGTSMNDSKQYYVLNF